MNQAKRERVKDAAKKRRTYLREVTQAEFTAGVALSVAVVSGMLAAYSLLLVLGLLKSGNVAAISFAFGGVIFAFITFGGWKIRQAYSWKAKVIPYVPPVAEQIANLPADEILVRGSEVPSATSNELLRAARAMDETPLQELLRPTENKRA